MGATHPAIVGDEGSATRERSLIKEFEYPDETSGRYKCEYAESWTVENFNEERGKDRSAGECEKKQEHGVGVFLLIVIG